MMHWHVSVRKGMAQILNLFKVLSGTATNNTSMLGLYETGASASTSIDHLFQFSKKKQMAVEILKDIFLVHLTMVQSLFSLVSIASDVIFTCNRTMLANMLGHEHWKLYALPVSALDQAAGSLIWVIIYLG